MKKSVQILLGAILFFFLIILCSGAENPAERNYPITFGDTITFDKPMIMDSGDTVTFVKVNDSTCIVINGDTVRIDGSGSIDNETDPIYSASVASGITSGDTANWNSVSASSFDSTYIYNEIDTLKEDVSNIMDIITDTVPLSSVAVMLADSGDTYYTPTQVDAAIAAGGGGDQVTLAGTPDYLTIDGQVITRGLIDVTTDITGNLPVANLNSGTGASGSTFWRGDGTWAVPSSGGGSASSGDTTYTASNDTVFALRNENNYPDYELARNNDTIFVDTTGMHDNSKINVQVYTSTTDTFVFASQLPIRPTYATDTFHNVADLVHYYEISLFDRFVKYRMIDTITASFAAGDSTTSYTDDFETYSTGNLNGQGSWNTIGAGQINVVDEGGDNRVQSASNFAWAHYEYGEVLSSDHYSQMVVDSLAGGNRYGGVCVRMGNDGSGFDGYCYVGDGVASILRRWTDGSPSGLGSPGSAWSVGDTIKIEIVGTTMTCYINGSVDTSVGTSGSYTDATHSIGNGGIAIYGETGANTQIDDFETGNQE